MSARHARPTRARSRTGEHALQPQPVWVSPDRVREPVRPYRRGKEARPSRRQRLARAAQQMLATSAAIAAAGLLGLVGSQGTLALWSSEETLPVGSIGVGTAEFLIGGPLMPFTNALPGEKHHYGFSIENTGSVNLAVSTSLSAETGIGVGHFEVRTLVIGAAEDCASYDLSIYPALTAVPAGTPALIRGGEELQVCAIVTALPEVEPTDSVEFTLLLDGVQTS